ncbi:MAG: glutathione S-transferase family protein [Bauldia sp.]|nr:glutathione S-transferase family protein [Bauldia sp.]
MLVLHHHPLSAPSRFVRLVLAEYGEEVTFNEVPPLIRSEALLMLNPSGTLPVLVEDGGTVIAEAPVIAEYLAETRGARFGEDSLMPATAVERAETRRLVHWFSNKMHNEATRHLVTELALKRITPPAEGGGAPDSVAIRAARANIRTHVQYISYLAERRDWLAGREMSLADLAAAAEISCVDYLGEVPWEKDEDAAKTWYARVKSRLSFRPLLADRIKGVVPAPHYGDLDF